MVCQSCESAPGLHRLEVVLCFGERRSSFVFLCDQCIRTAEWYCVRHECGKILVDDEEFTTGGGLAAVCVECCQEIVLAQSEEDTRSYLAVFAYCECEEYIPFALSVADFWEAPKTFTEAQRILYALAVGATIEDTTIETSLTHCLMYASNVQTLN